MKIGDRVKVIQLVCDDQSTNLEIGTIGTIKGGNGSMSVVDVDFSETFPFSGSNASCNSDGTYQMYAHQLEIIEENGGNNNE
jgi:hypothetical protein